MSKVRVFWCVVLWWGMVGVAFADEWGGSPCQTKAQREARAQARLIEKIKALGGKPGALGQLRKHLRDSRCQVARAAAQELGKMGPKAKAAIPTLLAIFRDKQGKLHKGPYVERSRLRKAAILALGTMGRHATPAIPAMVAGVGEKDWRVAEASARALGSLGALSLTGVSALHQALRKNEAGLRRAATWALGKIGKGASSALPGLLKALADWDPTVRKHALASLQAIGQPNKEHHPLLLYVLGHKHTDASGWAFAQKHLLRITGSKSLPTVLIQTLLRGQGSQSHKDAKQALYKIPKQSVPALLQALATDKEAKRKILREALAQMDAQIVPMLLVPLRKAETTRPQAIIVLGNMGPKAAGAVDTLIELFVTSDAGLSRKISFTLFQIGPGAISALRTALGSRIAKQRHAALQTLALFGAKAESAVPDLIPLLSEPQQKIRQQVVAILSKMGKGGQWALVKALASPNAEIAKQAHHALFNTGYELIPVLLRGLRAHPHPHAIHKACLQLFSEKKGLWVPALLKFLNSSTTNRKTAIKVLAFLGQVAVPRLLRSFSSVFERRRAGAAEALGRMGWGSPRTKRVLRQVALRDPSMRVRRIARDALRKMGAELRR